MTAKNDITGDSIITKVSSEAYRNNFDTIFRSKDCQKVDSDIKLSPIPQQQENPHEKAHCSLTR